MAELPSPDLVSQVAEANARIAARRAAAVVIHGAFTVLGDSSNPLALVTCGMHCEVCAFVVGGAFDLSLEPSVRAVEESLLLQLRERGCEHAAKVVEAEGIRERDDDHSDMP